MRSIFLVENASVLLTPSSSLLVLQVDSFPNVKAWPKGVRDAILDRIIEWEIFDTFDVIVKDLCGRLFRIPVGRDEVVSDLKERLLKVKEYRNLHAENLTLMFKNKRLENDTWIAATEIQNMSTVHLVPWAAGKARTIVRGRYYHLLKQRERRSKTAARTRINHAITGKDANLPSYAYPKQPLPEPKQPLPELPLHHPIPVGQIIDFRSVRIAFL
jgi:hypothetical protein